MALYEHIQLQRGLIIIMIIIMMTIIIIIKIIIIIITYEIINNNNNKYNNNKYNNNKMFIVLNPEEFRRLPYQTKTRYLIYIYEIHEIQAHI